MTLKQLLLELRRHADAMYHASRWGETEPWELENARIRYKRFLHDVYAPFIYQQEEDNYEDTGTKDSTGNDVCG